jgi:hypothetical protein
VVLECILLRKGLGGQPLRNTGTGHRQARSPLQRPTANSGDSRRRQPLARLNELAERLSKPRTIDAHA